MPQPIFDIPPNQTEEARLDAEADAEINAGRFVPHATVREWLSRLAKGERPPPPEACPPPEA